MIKSIMERQDFFHLPEFWSAFFSFVFEKMSSSLLVLLVKLDETRKTFHKNIFELPFRHMFSLKKHFIKYLLNNKNY